MSRVIILGAGASAGYESTRVDKKVPVARDLLETSAQIGILSESRYNLLKDFLEKYYKHQSTDSKKIDIDVEELMTLVDISRNTQLRKQLLRLITETLDKIIFGYQCEHHTRLLKSLSEEDTIITFNWDLILDNIMFKLGNLPSYGTNLILPANKAEFVPDERQWPQLLKLHGSFNWMYCRHCEQTYVHVLDGKTAAKYYDGEDIPCSVCEKRTKPVIIPPTLLKKYNNPVIRHIWKRARTALRNANEIVIVGYSLPVTDFQSKWLFMESSAEREHPLSRLRIFDKEKEPALTEPDSLIKKFARVFHFSPERIKYIEGGIKEASKHLENHRNHY